MELLRERAYVLAMLALQSERYMKDPDYRNATDDVLALTLFTEVEESTCKNCGFSREHHVQGTGYCTVGVKMGGAYTSQAQRDFCVAQGMPDAPICERFR